MPTEIEIVDLALRRIGASPVQSIDNPKAEKPLAIYRAIRDDILSRYPWTCCRRTRALSRLTAAPTQHWAYAYQMPSDILGAPRAAYDQSECRVPFVDWELSLGPDGTAAKELHSNATAVWLRFGIAAPPAAWPGYLLELVRLALMAEFALSIREDLRMWSTLRTAAYGSDSMMGEGGHFGQAKALDAYGEPSPSMAGGVNPLVDVRF